jgi:hypothetical protein
MMIFRENSISGCCVGPGSCMVSLTIFPNAGFAYIASHAIFGIIATRTPHFAILYFLFKRPPNTHIQAQSHLGRQHTCLGRRVEQRRRRSRHGVVCCQSRQQHCIHTHRTQPDINIYILSSMVYIYCHQRYLPRIPNPPTELVQITSFVHFLFHLEFPLTPCPFFIFKTLLKQT